jgi:hypothetical protein
MRVSGVIGLLAALHGCSGDASPAGGDLRTELPVIDVEPAEEITDLCYSWTLDNEEELYVNRVTLTATPGIHHSNWYFVPDRFYEGPDGLWPCDDRMFFQEIAAGAGGVLFAQSTQSTDETQQFPAGAAMVLPPHARVVSNLHLLNYGRETLHTRISLELGALTEEELEVKLTGLAMFYYPLEIPPRARSEFTVECDFDATHRTALGRPLDFSLYYVLPHYHGYGDVLNVSAVGGPRDGETVWETHAGLGEILGGPLDPPFELTGARGLRLTCVYDNPEDRTIRWGNGDGEMCVAFGYVDSENTWSGVVTEPNQVLGVREDGTTMNTSSCRIITIRASHERRERGM